MLNRNLADAAPQIFSTRLHVPRSPTTSIVEILRGGLHGFAAWRNRRRERKELCEFLAAITVPRRISDIGIGENETSSSLQAKRSNPKDSEFANLDCFVACVPRNDDGPNKIAAKTASAGRPIF